MLTITDLIAVISLCATFYSLGSCVESMIPRRKNNRPSSLQNMSGYF